MFRKHPFLCHSTYFIDLSVTAFAVPPPLIQGEANHFVDSLTDALQVHRSRRVKERNL